MKRVKAIASSDMEDEWTWNVWPYYRDRLAPQVSLHRSESGFTLVYVPYLTRICFTVLQLFDRQLAEDGDLLTQVWAPDWSPALEGEADPDDDDNIPIPHATRKGKDSDYTSVFRVSDDEDDDDCQILDLLDPTPISWAPPSVLAKTDAGTSKKRAAESESDQPPVTKRSNKVSKKPARVRNMPTTKG